MTRSLHLAILLIIGVAALWPQEGRGNAVPTGSDGYYLRLGRLVHTVNTSLARPSGLVTAGGLEEVTSGDDLVSTVPRVDLGEQLEVRLTFYVDRGVMRSGARTFAGAVAVDPKLIPLGSILYLPCIDRWLVALDTGGLVRGWHTDVWVADEVLGWRMLQRCGDRAEAYLLQKPSAATEKLKEANSD